MGLLTGGAFPQGSAIMFKRLPCRKKPKALQKARTLKGTRGSHARGSDYIALLSLDDISVNSVPLRCASGIAPLTLRTVLRLFLASVAIFSAREGRSGSSKYLQVAMDWKCEYLGHKYLLTVIKDNSGSNTFNIQCLKTLYSLFAAKIALTL